MRRQRIALIAAAVALGAPLAGCGSGSGGRSPATTSADGAPIASSDTGAAALRSRLTGLLTDHVYLVADAVSATVAGPAGGTASPRADAATAALDANAVALANAVAAGDGGLQRRFLGLWRAHDEDIVGYAKGRAAQDETAVQDALAKLDDDRLTFAALLAKSEPKLDKAKFAEDLKGHIETTAAAVDAIVAGAPDRAGTLAEAAAHMPSTAALLTEALVADHPDRFSGAADAGGAILRANLTGQLAGEAHLTLQAAEAAIADGARSPAVRRAAAAADANATLLSASISSVYGEQAGQDLLKLWRRRAAAFAAYTRAKLADDAGAASTALTALDASHDETATLLAGLDPQLRRGTITAALARYDDAMTAAIRAAMAQSPKRSARAADAAAAASGVATALARAITLQFPSKFPPST